MKLERYGAAAMATILLYKLLGGEDTAWVAAVVCMYLLWLVTLASVGEWMKERREKRYERDKPGSGRTESKAS